jgi:CheY-like chemotaxis protein
MGMALLDDTHLAPPVSIFNPVKILIVDDDAGTRRCLCRLLETFGYACAAAADGAEALGQTRRFKPQAIIMDLNMPRLDGFEAIRRIKSDPATQSIPVLALTANASLEDQEHANGLGVNAFLTKPTNLSELLAYLRRFAPLPNGQLN